MGGALGGIFSNVGQGTSGAPSFLQSLVQGTAKGAGKGLGQSMQTQGRAPMPGGGGGGLPGAPVVDSGYFAPSAAPPGSPASSGAPGMPQRMMPQPSPFYAQ